MVTNNSESTPPTMDFSKFHIWDTDQVDVRHTGLERYIIDLTKEYPPVDFLLEYNGMGCAPKGDLQAMTGKMKNGKSFACSCFEAAMLKGEFMGFTALKSNIRILHADTEQSPATVVKRARTVHTLCNWPQQENNERYRTIHLRECAYKDRLGKIVEAVEQFKPDFVLIDGVRDLLADINDPQESSKLIDGLMKLCNESAAGIMCVLHENKGDANMRGHLGTELGNKCSEAYKTSKNKEIFTVEQTVCRNESIENWAFSIGDGGIPQPEIVSYINPTKLRRDNCLEVIFKEQQSYTHTELWKAFTELYGCKERRAKEHITEATNDNVLTKKDDRYYYGGFTSINTESYQP